MNGEVGIHERLRHFDGYVFERLTKIVAANSYHARRSRPGDDPSAFRRVAVGVQKRIPQLSAQFLGYACRVGCFQCIPPLEVRSNDTTEQEFVDDPVRKPYLEQ